MGRKYIEKHRDCCKEITFHRRYKRYGKLSRDGRKALRREVEWCVICGRRLVNNKRKGKCRFTVAGFKKGNYQKV